MTDPAQYDEEDSNAVDAASAAVECVDEAPDNQAILEAALDRVTDALENADIEAVKSLCDDLHPADLADLIALLHESRRAELVQILGDEMPAEALAELDAGLTEEVVLAMEPETVAEAVAELDTDDAAFILEDLDEERRDEILAEVPLQDRIALRQAFDYEEDSAGRVMQREVFAAPGYWTVGQIIDRMRGSDDLPDRFYEVFVIDPSFKPIGAVTLSTLLKTPRETKIEDIMSPDFHTVRVDTDKEEVGFLFDKYNLISAPVVDLGGRLTGMITVDDVVEIVQEETQEDMLALAGVEADTGITDTVLETVRSRFSWLAVNLATAIFASLVISLFDAAISQVVALAVLMPIVASMGGNAGTQTLTVAVRSLATKELTTSNAARIVWRETKVGMLNGVLFAIIMGALAGIWYSLAYEDSAAGLDLGLVVGVAMVINLVAAALAGILVPLSLQRAGQDPAVASAVFVTTVTDVIGFFVFLGLAAIVLI